MLPQTSNSQTKVTDANKISTVMISQRSSDFGSLLTLGIYQFRLLYFEKSVSVTRFKVIKTNFIFGSSRGGQNSMNLKVCIANLHYVSNFISYTNYNTFVFIKYHYLILIIMASSCQKFHCLIRYYPKTRGITITL